MPETFVLIPGAWRGGWAWRPVAHRLRAAGHRVHSLTLPGLADGDDRAGLRLADAVDHIVDRVTQLNLRDVTLVAHCWGGFPMTGAAHRLRGRVARLVYWSAYVPEPGRSFLTEATERGAAMCRQLAAASSDNSVPMPFEAWRRVFIQDASDDVQRMLHSLLVPQPFGYLDDAPEDPPVTSLGLPVSYLVSSEDLVYPRDEPGWGERFAHRAGTNAVEVPGSHEACFTRPAELAAAILKA